jgi:hypothetical protein
VASRRQRASHRDRARLPHLYSSALVVLAAAALIGAGSTSAAAARPHALTLYSVAEQEQYINNSDSLIRGSGNNPFGNYTDQAPIANTAPNGPFPGDEALFSFNLYTGSNLHKRAGTAVFTCQYNFKKNAFCDAAFRLRDGSTLIASGAFNFSASKFALAVTGGEGSYADAQGSVVGTPSAHHAQRLDFRLT